MLKCIPVREVDLGRCVWFDGNATAFGIYDKLLASCKKHGKFAGLHNGTSAYAARMIGMGFRFVTIANDSGLMARAAREAVTATRKAAGDVAI